MSRVKTCDNFYCRGKFKKSAIKVNKIVWLKTESVKQDISSHNEKKKYYERYRYGSCS